MWHGNIARLHRLATACCAALKGKLTNLAPTRALQNSAFKIPISVLVVMYDAAGRFLLIERADHPGFWQSVTGSLDFLEEPLGLAAQRELFEETGFAASVHENSLPLAQLGTAQLHSPLCLRAYPHEYQYSIYPQWRHRYAPGVTRNTEHWFAVCLPQGAVPTLALREHTGYEWLGAQAAIRRCFSANNAQAIKQLAGWLKKAS